MKRLVQLCLVLLSGLILLPLNTDAQNKKKRKKRDAVEATAAVPEKKSKEKTIEELTKSSKPIDGLFKIYRDTITGDVQMVISQDQIGKEYIHFAQIADGVMDAGRMNRGSYKRSKIFKIEKFLLREILKEKKLLLLMEMKL